MAKKAPDLTGRVFSKLTVLRPGSRGRKGELFWVCRCECGKEKEVKAQRLRVGNTKSCGCYSSIWQSEAGKKAKKEGTAFRNVLYYYRANARKRGLSWELNEEQFRNIVTSPCHYTGLLESNELTTPAGEKFKYNGVDRIDNNEGYTLSNSVPCCKIVNAAKSDMTYLEFINMCRTITERINL